MSQQPQFEFEFVEDLRVRETFSDSIKHIAFENGVMKIEFCATRIKEIQPHKKAVKTQHPVCRLVLSAPTVIELFNELRKIMSALEQSGQIKPIHPVSKTIQ